MTGAENYQLSRVRAGHPGWVIRRESGPEWSAWTASRVQVVIDKTLTGLAAKLDEADPHPFGPSGF